MTLLLSKRIVSDSKILGGKAVIKGTRISVEFILELIASGMSFDEILEEYKELSRADIKAALGFARQVIAKEEIMPMKLVTRTRN